MRYFLEQCLRSVERAIKGLDAEIIVIDNDSKDESCKMVKELFPNVKLIENKKNVGFSKANNQAVAVAKGEYICILNPDTAVEEETFRLALQYSEKQPKMGALGVYLMDGTGHFLPESKRNLPTPKVSLMKLAGFSKQYYSDIQDNSSGIVEVLVGAFMFLKKSIYIEVEGFDEDYFMYGEDIDLSYKITQAGYHNHYLGSATVLHYKGESTQKDKIYFDRFYGAMQIFYRKHFNKNIFLENAVNIAVAGAKKMRSLTLNRKHKPSQKVNHRYFLTTNYKMVEKLNEATQENFVMITREFLEGSNLQNCLLVMDAEYLDYTMIFRYMKRFKGNGNRFRIKPPLCQFIVGSDQSDEKGGAIVF